MGLPTSFATFEVLSDTTLGSNLSGYIKVPVTASESCNPAGVPSVPSAFTVSSVFSERPVISRYKVEEISQLRITGWSLVSPLTYSECPWPTPLTGTAPLYPAKGCFPCSAVFLVSSERYAYKVVDPPTPVSDVLEVRFLLRSFALADTIMP